MRVIRSPVVRLELTGGECPVLGAPVLQRPALGGSDDAIQRHECGFDQLSHDRCSLEWDAVASVHSSYAPDRRGDTPGVAARRWRYPGRRGSGVVAGSTRDALMPA